MKFLLDTHVFLWFIGGNAKLPAEWRDTIRQPHHEVYLRGSPETFRQLRYSEIPAAQTEQVCAASSECC